ncbi:MAG TPA: MarR family transcriptional regulator [Verrucomicrobiae bacterium]
MRDKQTATSGLEGHLGYWLRFVSNHVSQAFARKVQEQGVTVAEWVVLRALFDVTEINASGLVERVGLTKGAVSKLVERLVNKGLMNSMTDEQDRRVQRLKLTSAGRKLVPVLAALADKNDEEFFGHLNIMQRKEVTGVLQEIVRRHGLKDVPVD